MPALKATFVMITAVLIVALSFLFEDEFHVFLLYMAIGACIMLGIIMFFVSWYGLYVKFGGKKLW